MPAPAPPLPAHSRTPESRIRTLNDRTIRESSRFVLYWMTGFRRTVWNFSLDLAVDWARELRRPLVIFEALRCDYRWACDRFHQFILQGMRDNLLAARAAGIAYYPFVEEEQGQGDGLLAALAAEACLVVGDDFPSFFLPRMLDAAAKRIDAPLYAVDSNGLLPLRATEKVFARAVDFRRFLQKELPGNLTTVPRERPFQTKLPELRSLPKELRRRWPSFEERLDGESWNLASFPIDHDVRAVEERGGSSNAKKVWKRFLHERLSRYDADRNEPDERATSELSPYLHFGFFSVHQAFRDLARRDGWSIERLGKATGKREGWWRMSPEAEAFLDELVTWRELGYNRSAHADRSTEQDYGALPEWARKTLDDHRRDRRQPT